MIDQEVIDTIFETFDIYLSDDKNAVLQLLSFTSPDLNLSTQYKSGN